MAPDSVNRPPRQTADSLSSAASSWTKVGNLQQHDGHSGSGQQEPPLGDPRDINYYLALRYEGPQSPQTEQHYNTTSKGASNMQNNIHAPPPPRTTGSSSEPQANRTIGPGARDWFNQHDSPRKSIASGKKSAALGPARADSANAFSGSMQLAHASSMPQSDECDDDDRYDDDYGQYDKYYGDDLEVVKGKKCYRK